MEKTQSFWQKHSDTIVIIGVNATMVAIIVSMFLSMSSRIDVANARIDTIYVMFYDLLREVKK